MPPLDQAILSGISPPLSFPENIRKKALCVGISYKGQRGPYNIPPETFELKGAHNDAWSIHNLLRDVYDYHEEDITMLLDKEGYEQPTKENIINAMNALVDNAKPGENLFFFFAGHGDQITNIDGEEDDGKDEIILPMDWELDESLPQDDRNRYRQIIIDDDMNNILVKRLPPSCRLTGLFDSCHSGTILDLPYTRSFGPRSRSPPLPNGETRYQSITATDRTTSPEPTSPKSMQRRLHHPPRETIILDSSITATDRTTSPEPTSPKSMQRRHHHPLRETIVLDSPTYSVPPSEETIHTINQRVGRGPLDLSFTLTRVHQRGRKHPYWREGSWILRGETLDSRWKDRIHDIQPKHAISWSACSDGQIGYEIISKSQEHRNGGVMVKAFVKLLREEPYRTYQDILECLGDSMKTVCSNINKKTEDRTQWIMQEPQLGSYQKPDLDKLFAP